MEEKIKELGLRGYLLEINTDKDGNPAASYIEKDGTLYTFVAASENEAVMYAYNRIVGTK